MSDVKTLKRGGWIPLEVSLFSPLLRQVQSWDIRVVLVSEAIASIQSNTIMYKLYCGVKISIQDLSKILRFLRRFRLTISCPERHFWLGETAAGQKECLQPSKLASTKVQSVVTVEGYLCPSSALFIIKRLRQGTVISGQTNDSLVSFQWEFEEQMVWIVHPRNLISLLNTTQKDFHYSTRNKMPQCITHVRILNSNLKLLHSKLVPGLSLRLMFSKFIYQSPSGNWIKSWKIDVRLSSFATYQFCCRRRGN